MQLIKQSVQYINQKTDKDSMIDHSEMCGGDEHVSLSFSISRDLLIQSESLKDNGFTSDVDAFEYIWNFVKNNPFTTGYRSQDGYGSDKLIFITSLKALKDSLLDFLIDEFAGDRVAGRSTFKVTTTIKNALKLIFDYRLAVSFTTSDVYLVDGLRFVVPPSLDLVTTGTANAKETLEYCNNKLKDADDNSKAYFTFLRNCAQSELSYNELKEQYNDEVAQYVLPMNTAIDLYISGFDSDIYNIMSELKKESDTEDLNQILEFICDTITANNNLQIVDDEDRDRSDNDSEETDQH